MQLHSQAILKADVMSASYMKQMHSHGLLYTVKYDAWSKKDFQGNEIEHIFLSSIAIKVIFNKYQLSSKGNMCINLLKYLSGKTFCIKHVSNGLGKESVNCIHCL